MSYRIGVYAAVIWGVCFPTHVCATRASRDEMDSVGAWTRANLAPETIPPVSFNYAGRSSADFIKTWKSQTSPPQTADGRTERAITWTDPQGGLVLRCTVVEYTDFPTIEWTIHFRNAGSTDTAIVENVRAMDVWFDRGDAGEFVLHHFRGSSAGRGDYEPLLSTLSPGTNMRLAPAGGRPSNGVWPYFNLEWAGGGLVVAIGWPGQWAAEFTRDAAGKLHLVAGQELTRFALHPGEEVRGPRIVMQFYKGDWIRSQNLWRRWMMAHNMPRPGGKLPAPQFVAASSRQYNEMVNADEACQKMFIDRYIEESLPLDFWWMDAGWYVNNGNWPNVGTWQVDRKRFPNGLRAVSDYAHARNIRIILWFEPERVDKGTWLTDNHPEWIIGGKDGGLLNLGNADARNWLTNHVDRLLTDEGIDLYRQDFNMDPLGHWRRSDTPDRQGITEIRHVEGYLAYWDELRRRRPNMLIDACASGGRRNDVETLKRAVPLWRSDLAYDSIGCQCQTYGISFWAPYHGTATVGASEAPYYGEGKTPIEPYAVRSNVAPSTGCGIDMRQREIDYAAFRRLIMQWRQHVAPHYYGDYYPLTDYTQADNAWMAWQFDSPDAGAGVVQAFRRPQSPNAGITLKLRGLDPQATYTVTDLDAPAPKQMTGEELMGKGLEVVISGRPGAAVIAYRKS